jgi:hypothetical protein
VVSFIAGTRFDKRFDCPRFTETRSSGLSRPLDCRRGVEFHRLAASGKSDWAGVSRCGVRLCVQDGSQAEASPPTLPPGTPPAVAAIQAGIQKYTDIKASSLAIYAVPNGEGNDAARIREGQMKAFEKGVPSSHIVRLPGANHYVFISNEADVLKEMRGFIGSLKKQ